MYAELGGWLKKGGKKRGGKFSPVPGRVFPGGQGTRGQGGWCPC